MKRVHIYRKTLFLLVVLFSLVRVFASSDELERIRKAIEEKGARWQAEENWVTRLSPEERRRLYGTILGQPDLSKTIVLSLPSVGELPSEFDWRDNNGNWDTPVRNQESCGSCWDFSAVAQVETWWKITRANHPDSVIDLSEQFILSCSDAGSCGGGRIEGALDFVQSTGVPWEDCFPYYANDGVSCGAACSDWADEAVRIPGWGYVTLEEAVIENIKSAIFFHPVSAAFVVYNDFEYYSGGVYEPVGAPTGEGHAILIVGWSDADSCWICKNSWGTNWGETLEFTPYTWGAGDGGYFRMKYGVCEIGEYIPFVWGETTSGPALVVSPERLDFSVVVGASASDVITVRNVGYEALEFSSLDFEVPIFRIDDFMAYDGFSWWNGDPGIGGYHNHWLQYLDTPALDLSQTTSPKLTWMGYWAIEEPEDPQYPYDGWDGCNAWVSTDGGNSFQVADPTTPSYNCQSLWSFGHPDQGWDMGVGVAGWGGSSGGWLPVEFDLSGYRSDSTVVRFAFASDLALCTVDTDTLTGFFVDDIRVADGSTVLFENDADAPDGMQTLGYGFMEADWIGISSTVESVSPGDSLVITVSVDASDLVPGSYQGVIQLTSNDTTQALMEIPVHLEVESATDVPPDIGDNVPEGWSLSQNYPNPFNATTMIRYGLPETSEVTLTVYDFLGRRVKTLVDGVQGAGYHRVAWDGSDASGNRVSSGLYFVRLRTKDWVQCRKIVLLK